jgi:hypothetical protein
MPLRYHHDDHTRELRDVRKSRSVEVPSEQVFFVVFRVWYVNELHYHHALILADGHESFADGIAGEIQFIVDHKFARYKIDISLVFVRSLMMQRQDIKELAMQMDITTGIRKGISRRNDDKFMAFGLVGDKDLSLIKVEADDALKAIECARTKCLNQHQKKFTPMEICQAHPVTSECYALFDVAAARIKALIDAKPCNDGYLH